MDARQRRKTLSEVALGRIAPDFLVTCVEQFNAHTREFIPNQSIWIKDGYIAYVGPDQDPLKDRSTQVIDGAGRVVLPGLIDAHTHLTGNRACIEEVIRHIIPGGTTTVITETIELASIAGKEALDVFVRGFENQPIRFYYTVPPLCALTLAEEVNAPPSGEYLPFLKDSRCLGLGEVYWSNLFLKGKQADRVTELVDLALELGKRVEGHTAGASGRKLQAYTCFDISSCHEPISEKEALERLRLGYWVMIREGSIRKELDAIKGIFDREIDFRRLILSTDGIYPDDMLESGYLDAVVRKTLALGVPPGLVYQMVTLNAAEHFRLDHFLGSLAPGKVADLVIIPSRDVYSPRLVMAGGKVVFRDGETLVEPRRLTFPDHLFHTVRPAAHKIPATSPRGKTRVIELVTDLVTKEQIVDWSCSEESKDVIPLLAVDRLGGGKAFAGYLKGFGLKRGAIGSTMCWDTVDLIVAGWDPSSIQTVIERLKAIGGGAVFAVGKEIVSELSAPLCGVLSLKSMEAIRDEIRHLETALWESGVRSRRPLLTLDTLGSPAIPHLRITDHGYIRLKDRQELGVEV